MRGSDVRELQSRLTEAGVYSGPITGYFGALTQAGVRKYQIAKNILPQSGYVGPLTRLALSVPRSTPSVPAPTTIVQTPAPEHEETQKKINALQAQLLNLLKLLEETRAR
ncbi:MAG: peptidoglycan-binding domain-containing protein [Nanoarchaeota archaeon]|nr:peptidoglycan-binding domain-containing protein [Nanoarchaeota archaeon]